MTTNPVCDAVAALEGQAMQHQTSDQLIRSRCRDLNVVIAVCIIAGALRLVGLVDKSFWYDEVLSARTASHGFLNIPRMAMREEVVTPPLYFMLVRTLRLISDQDWVQRIPSVIAGIALVAVIYFVGAEWMNSRCAGWAAALGAVSPFAVRYAQELRQYSLFWLFSWLHLLFFVRIRKDPQRVTWVLFTLTWLLALMMNIVAVILIPVECICLLGDRRPPWAVVKRWAVAVALGLLCMLPWCVLLYLNLHGFVQKAISDTERDSFDVALVRVFLEFGFGFFEGLRRNPPERLLGLAMALFLVMCLCGAVRFTRSGVSEPLVLLMSVVGIGVLSVYYNLPRHMGLAYPAVCLLCGAGIDGLCSRAPGVGRGAGLAILLINAFSLQNYLLRSEYRPDDWRGTAAWVRRYATPDDAVILNGGYESVVWDYYQRHRLTTYLFFPSPHQSPREKLLPRVESIHAKHDRIWLIESRRVDPEGLVLSWLNERMTTLKHAHFKGENGIDVHLFVRPHSTAAQ